MRKYATRATLLFAAGAVALSGALATTASAVPGTGTGTTKGSALLTIDAYGEQYKVRVSDPAVVERAEELMKFGPTEDGANIPHGQLVKTPSYSDNPDWAGGDHPWHINPDTFKFSEVSSKGCDVPPSHVAPPDMSWAMGYLCPWQGKVVKIEKSGKL
ncbi:hypothetical protein AB0N09_34510 [Streptomyces erythrochromogenes]|uniref:BP74-related protein n=1 Tax=Streptomyces erythrochromogenes TaxID=285574 RepID=UPI003423B239